MVNHLAPNIPLNIPALEALESMTGFVPDDVRDSILRAPLSDNLSGLREIASRIQEPDEWQGIRQPKQEIGDYVESQGFNVPKRYASFEDAMAVVDNGGTIIIRSEHPDEYDGFSGLLESYIVNQDVLGQKHNPAAEYIGNRRYGLSAEDILHDFKRDSLDSLPIKRYLALSGQTDGQFYDDMSYSFWQHIPGHNIMVVADDSVAGRYHITGAKGLSGGGGVYDTEGTAEVDSDKQIPLSKEVRADLIDTYEQIKSLPRFDVRQCPIMELQLGGDGKIWFLQYHKARPFRPSPIRLDENDYPASDGWHRAEAVRGALGSFVTLKAAFWYPPKRGQPSLPAYIPTGPEEASFDTHYDIGLTEYVSRTRIAYIGRQDRIGTYAGMADGKHEVRSRWFKPSSALCLGGEACISLIPKDMTQELSRKIHREYRMGRFVLDTASDGLTGFVRLNPDSEQPIYTNE